MSKTKKWVVTLSNTHPLSEIVEKVKESGFKVEHVLSEIGCITGGASEEAATKVRNVKGVADVAEEVNVDVGPPDNPTTW